MGYFINSRFFSTCKETDKKVRKGDRCYYVPGTGVYGPESSLYQEMDKKEKEEQADQDGKMVQANEEAYFDNFYARNYPSGNL
jgi:hypothetical protein